MTDPYPIPDQKYLDRAKAATPEHMRPNDIPFVVVWEGALTDEVCDAIINRYMVEEPYPFTGCDGITRECPIPLDDCLRPVFEFATGVNDIWWKFTLDALPGAWLQTYEVGDSYQMHTDGTIGQSRKLTAIALLSHPAQYEGGELRMISHPTAFVIPKTRGTIVVLPAWVLHDVTPVESGIRQTVNVGFWGPTFK